MGLVEKIKTLIPPEMTIADFEIATGLSKNSFYRLDKNKPRIDCVVEMAKILNVSVDYLVGLTDEKKPVPTDEDGLSDREKLVLSLFNRLPAANQEGVIAQLQGLVQFQAAQDAQSKSE